MRPFLPLLQATGLVVLLAGWAGPVAGQTPCPDPPLYPPTRAFVDPPRPCPDQDVSLRFATCAPCWDIVSVAQEAEGITVRTEQRPDLCLPDLCLPESASVGLGRLAAGHHAVVVRFVTDVRVGVGADTAHCEFVNVDTVRFDVTTTCAQNTLPYVTEVVIGSPPCVGCPPRVCVGDSIPVLIRGEFPDDCIGLAGVEVIPDASMGPIPRPPTVRLVYEANDCLGRPCALTPYPWQAKVMLPPLPALTDYVYWLQVEAALVRRHCVPPPDSSVIGEARFPFVVSDPCTTRRDSCFLASFAIRSGAGFERCDDFVGPGRPGHATFRIGSSVPLSGLEGEFVFYQPYLAVTGIEAVDAAAGMQLAWQPTATGARFVLFSTTGAQIAAVPPMPSSEHLPILRVRVEPRLSGDPPPPRVRMGVVRLLGADANGHGVFLCPIFTLVVPYDAYAMFCTGPTCDVDGNGATDVRDLVRMVRCFHNRALCTVESADCDGDGGFDLDDVMCCAEVLLGGGSPDTTGARPDPTLRVRFGAPVEDGGTIAVPVTLEGANPVAGARLVLRYPDERFGVASVEFAGRSNWLELHEARDGQVVVGLLEMGGTPSTPFQHSFTLRLGLRAGQRAGGRVTLEAAEFADPLGVALLADLGAPSVILGGGRLALGPGQPNPFADQVEFAVTLAAPADLEVTVHDLTGRLVMTLHRGLAAAGGQMFRWDGRDASGARAPEGVYFYRARGAGETLARKIILLRTR
jgi:hypothetical protein